MSKMNYMCKWAKDVDTSERECSEVYDTQCNNEHVLIDGNPKDHGFKYCPYCGKQIYVETE